MYPSSPTRLGSAALVILALATTGCASTGGGGPSGDPDVITYEELQTVVDRSAYEAVRRLRPQWLRARTSGFDAPQRQTASVYVDGLKQDQGLAALSDLDTADVQEMRFLSAAEATTRFGTNNVGGAILVTTRR